jgi:predicted DNA-binding transcriptional regulator AlpA
MDQPRKILQLYQTPLQKLLLTYPDLKQIGICFSRKHINWLMARGRFPKPIRLGGSDMSTKAHWRYADILAWIEERAVASGLQPLANASSQNADTAGREPAAS